MVYGTDVRLNFEENDIKFAHGNNFEFISDTENLEQAIKTRLLTKKDTLATHQEFGSNLHLLIGTNGDEEALNTAGTYVYQALDNEPRIKEVTEVLIDYRIINDVPNLVIFLTVTPITEDVPLNLVVNHEV